MYMYIYIYCIKSDIYICMHTHIISKLMPPSARTQNLRIPKEAADGRGRAENRLGAAAAARRAAPAGPRQYLAERTGGGYQSNG